MVLMFLKLWIVSKWLKELSKFVMRVENTKVIKPFVYIKSCVMNNNVCECNVKVKCCR